MENSKIVATHIFSAKMSEKHIEQMAGGIKITPRNLAFIKTDRNKNNFDDKNVDETIKTILTFYYFNSFIETTEQKLENNNLYTKEKFKEDVDDIFQKKTKFNFNCKYY